MQQIKILTALVLLMLLANCTPYTYTYTNPLPNDPAFTRGGQFKAGGQIGYLSAHGQASVSPINYLAVIGGYSRGYLGHNEYNFGGQLFAPVAKLKNGRLFTAFTAYFEGGNINRLIKNSRFFSEGIRSFDINANYSGYSFQPSVYFVTQTENANIKIGATYRNAQIVYNRLFFEERLETADTTTIAQFTNATNTTFNGHAGWLYFMYEGKNDRFYAITQIGLSFDGFVAAQVMPQVSSYTFKPSLLITGTFGIRLWNK